MSIKRTAVRMKNPPHPGLGVKADCLEPFGLSVTEGAKILGVARQTLSNLTNQKTDLSWDMAIRLSKTGSTQTATIRGGRRRVNG